MTRLSPIKLQLNRTDDKNGGFIDTYFGLLEINVENKDRHRNRNIDCLVDSGSFTNLFPAELADRLHIDLKSVNSRKIYGIGGKEVTAYRHLVTLRVRLLGNHITFDTFIDFSEGVTGDGLLGLNGFFDKFYSVTFCLDKKELYLVKDESDLS